ncbi:hypothetical protein MASR1M101_17620 [Gemmatimonas sp.]
MSTTETASSYPLEEIYQQITSELDTRRQALQTADGGIRKNNSATCAARRRRFPYRKGNRGRRKAAAPVPRSGAPNACELRSVVPAVCRLRLNPLPPAPQYKAGESQGM